MRGVSQRHNDPAGDLRGATHGRAQNRLAFGTESRFQEALAKIYLRRQILRLDPQGFVEELCCAFKVTIKRQDARQGDKGVMTMRRRGVCRLKAIAGFRAIVLPEIQVS